MTALMKLKVAPPIGDVCGAIREAIERAIEGSSVEVTGGGGHFSISVVSAAFAGLSRLESQRLVLRAIKDLMAGDGAPVHAVDSLVTRTP